MSERWFDQGELDELSRPTMDRAIEAIDEGDPEAARELCKSMKREWGMLHDLMTESVLGLVTFIQNELGDDGVKRAWEFQSETGWRRHHDAIQDVDRKKLVYLLAATWRAHSCSGTGEQPGAFTITEDDEKFTFAMDPCGSGQRLVRRGLYESQGYGKTHEAHDWSFGRKDFPLYCTHCSFMNESLPIKWSGYPLYPLDPPGDYVTDPCRWYWYKNPDSVPERFWKRYGAVKPERSSS